MCQNFDTKFVSYASGSLYDVREMFRFNDKEKQNGGEAQKEVPSSIGHFAKLAQKMCPKVAPARWTDADISNWKSGKKSISYDFLSFILYVEQWISCTFNRYV